MVSLFIAGFVLWLNWSGTSPDQNMLLVPGPGQSLLPSGGEPRPIEASAWADASTSALQLGNARIRLTGVGVGKIGVKSSEGKTAKKLSVWVRIDHVGTGGHVHYRNWDGTEGVGGKTTAVLMDNQGNRYAFRDLGPNQKFDGHTSTASIVPRGYVSTELVFDPPPVSIAFLQLELSATAVGNTGTFRFQIPRGMINYGAVR